MVVVAAVSYSTTHPQDPHMSPNILSHTLCVLLSDDNEVINNLSPMLQGQVAMAANAGWLSKVWWLSPAAVRIFQQLMS